MATNLEQLRNQVLGASQRAIRRDHPDFECKYREALGGGETHDDFSRAAAAVLKIETPRFARWRQLLLAIFDLELSIARLETAYALLATLPGEPVTGRLHVTRGRWADYHYAAWLFSALAVLERADTLTTRAWRYLVRPYPTPGVVDRAILTRRLTRLITAIKELRNAEAHGGGSAIQVLADRRRLDEWAVLGFWPPVAEILERFPSTTHPRQVRMAQEMTKQCFVAIDATALDILHSVDWGALQ